MRHHIMKLVAFSIAFLLIFLASCKEAEIPKSTLGFAEMEMEVMESDGKPESFHPLLFKDAKGRELIVEIVLDRALAETSVIAFTLEGTSLGNSTTNPIGDYEIKGNDENLTIQKGETSAKIVLQLYEDGDFGFDDNGIMFQTIEIKLASVISGTAIIGENDTFTLTITEDDAVVFLDWDDGDGDATPDRGDVDMDLILQLDGSVRRQSAAEGSESYEAFNIPAAFPNGTYGLSYTYYSGTSNAVKFSAFMFNFGGTLNGKRYDSFDNDGLTFGGDYKLVNINKYDAQDAPDPAVVQTMTKNGFNYSNITQITEPATGSRVVPSRNFLDLKSVAPKKISGDKLPGLLGIISKK